VIVLFLLLAQAEPENDLGRGPLHMTSLSPFQSFRPGFTPRPPSDLPEGTWELRISESWANLWAFNEDDILIDMEILHTNVAIGLGLGEGVRADLEVESGSRFGGFMDRLIDNVHRIVGAETRHREEFDRNDFALDLQGRDGRPSARLRNRDRGIYTTSLVGTLQWTFSDGGPGRPALSAALSLRSDVGPSDGLHGGSPVDVALSLSAAERWGPLILSASVMVAWYGEERFQHIDLEPLQMAGLVAVEWPFHKRASLLLQYLMSQGVAEDWLDFSRPSHEIVLGFKIDIRKLGAVLEIGGLENLGIPDNSPDFGLHAGLTFRF
jgi:hypothetical protein